jgi:hypothetical protein
MAEYDISGWHFDPTGHDKNIVLGVTKYSHPVTIVIRPTDNRTVKFHTQIEIESLKKANSELWGDNGALA